MKLKAPAILLLIGVMGAFNFVSAATLDQITMTANNGTIDSTYNSGGHYMAYYGFSYRPGASHQICSVTVNQKAKGTPTDAIMLNVYLGSTQQTNVFGQLYSFFGTGAGTLVRSADSGFQDRNTTLHDQVYTFTPCLQVAGGWYYNFVWQRTPNANINDSTNGYIFRGDYSNLAATTHTGTGEFHFDFQYHDFTYKGACSSTTNCPDHAPPIGFDVALAGTEDFGLIAPSSTPSFGQSVINEVLGINDNTASSTAVTGFARFWGLQGLLQTKFPFNYLFEIGTAFSQLSYGTTTTAWSFRLPLDYGSHTSLDVLPSSWDVISTTTMSVYYGDTIRLFFRGLVGTLLTVAWGFYMFNRVRFLFV